MSLKRFTKVNGKLICHYADANVEHLETTRGIAPTVAGDFMRLTRLLRFAAG